MQSLAVLLVSVAPAAAFLVLILRMDRREPEPLRLVLRIMGLGAAGAVVAALVELGLGRLPVFQEQGSGLSALDAFVRIAPVEELCKLGVVLLFAWDRPEFNEENDGVVYMGASAVGFALLENILYVAENGVGVGILRAFTAVPAHVFTAVILGLHLGRARFAAAGARPRLVLQGFAIAWAAHGAYDTLAGSGSGLALLLLPLLAGLAAFGVLALRRGRALSLARWGGGEPVVPADPAAVGAKPKRPAPAPHAWMAVIARILLALCIAFWLLMIIGAASPEKGTNIGDAIMGGVLITAIPAGVGILLEIRYRRARAHARSAAQGA
jgi:RsiW-degrading membrane proteinase PrsW (M82 family)